jgi:NAD-dependent dihydropyrimidine dehydrogenase PreA subunit
MEPSPSAAERLTSTRQNVQVAASATVDAGAVPSQNNNQKQQTMMTKKQNRVFGLSFLGTIAAMIIFNSCSKYTDTYSINNDKCALCLSCVSVCGQHAISVQGSGSSEYVTIDQDKCIGCGKCYNACKYGAISSN